MNEINETIEKVNNIFDRQIKKKCKASFYEKKLFNLTLDFTPNDWRVIRTKKYFSISDSLHSRLEKSKYLFECVDYYINNIR